MQREGSPWQGLGVVTLKELSDHLTSWRMLVLEWLIAITAVVSVYGAIQQIREATAEDPFLLLRLFTRGSPFGSRNGKGASPPASGILSSVLMESPL